MSNLKRQPEFNYQTPRSCPFIAFLADEYKLRMFLDWAFENPKLFFYPGKTCIPVVWLPPKRIDQITAYFDSCTGFKSGGAADQGESGGPQSLKFGFAFIVRGLLRSGVITDQGYGAADLPIEPGVYPIVTDVGFMELYGGYKLLEAISPIDNPAMQRCVLIRADSDEAINVLNKLWHFHIGSAVDSAVDAAGIDGINLQTWIKRAKSLRRTCMQRLSFKILVLFRDKYTDCDLQFEKIPREGNFPCDWLSHIGYKSNPSDPLLRDRPVGPDGRPCPTYAYLEGRDLEDGFCHITPVGCYNCGKLAHKKEECPYIDLAGVDLSKMVTELIDINNNNNGGPPGHSGGGGGHGSTAAGLSSSVVHSQGTSSQGTSSQATSSQATSSQATSSGSAASTSAQPASGGVYGFTIPGHSQATSSGSAASTSAEPASPSPINSRCPPAAGGGYSRYPPAAGGGYGTTSGSFSSVLSQVASSALSYPSFGPVGHSGPVDYQRAVAYPGYSSGSRSNGSGSSGIRITCQKCGLVSPGGRVCDCLKRK